MAKIIKAVDVVVFYRERGIDYSFSGRLTSINAKESYLNLDAGKNDVRFVPVENGVQINVEIISSFKVVPIFEGDE